MAEENKQLNNAAYQKKWKADNKEKVKFDKFTHSYALIYMFLQDM